MKDICPYCNAEIELPADSPEFVCPACGALLVLDDEDAETNATTPPAPAPPAPRTGPVKAPTSFSAPKTAGERGRPVRLTSSGTNYSPANTPAENSQPTPVRLTPTTRAPIVPGSPVHKSTSVQTGDPSPPNETPKTPAMAAALNTPPDSGDNSIAQPGETTMDLSKIKIAKPVDVDMVSGLISNVKKAVPVSTESGQQVRILGGSHQFKFDHDGGSPTDSVRIVEEARKQAEAEARLIAEEARRQVEEAKLEAERARQQAETEARRFAEEASRQAEEARRAAEEARRKAEEDAKRYAQVTKKRADAEAKRIAEEAQQQAMEFRKRQAEELARQNAKAVAIAAAKKKALLAVRRKAQEVAKERLLEQKKIMLEGEAEKIADGNGQGESSKGRELYMKEYEENLRTQLDVEMSEFESQLGNDESDTKKSSADIPETRNSEGAESIPNAPAQMPAAIPQDGEGLTDEQPRGDEPTAEKDATADKELSAEEEKRRKKIALAKLINRKRMQNQPTGKKTVFKVRTRHSPKADSNPGEGGQNQEQSSDEQTPEGEA